MAETFAAPAQTRHKKGSPEALAMRERLRHEVAPDLPPAPEGRPQLTGLGGLSDFVAKADPESAANAMLCAVNQAAYLLRRQIEQQTREFLEKGGFTENLYSARVKARASAAAAHRQARPACRRAVLGLLGLSGVQGPPGVVGSVGRVRQVGSSSQDGRRVLVGLSTPGGSWRLNGECGLHHEDRGWGPTNGTMAPPRS